MSFRSNLGPAHYVLTFIFLLVLVVFAVLGANLWTVLAAMAVFFWGARIVQKAAQENARASQGKTPGFLGLRGKQWLGLTLGMVLGAFTGIVVYFARMDFRAGTSVVVGLREVGIFTAVIGAWIGMYVINWSLKGMVRLPRPRLRRPSLRDYSPVVILMTVLGAVVGIVQVLPAEGSGGITAIVFQAVLWAIVLGWGGAWLGRVLLTLLNNTSQMVQAVRAPLRVYGLVGAGLGTALGATLSMPSASFGERLARLLTAESIVAMLFLGWLGFVIGRWVLRLGSALLRIVFAFALAGAVIAIILLAHLPTVQLSLGELLFSGGLLGAAAGLTLIQRTFATILRAHIGAAVGMLLALNSLDTSLAVIPVTTWLLLGVIVITLIFVWLDRAYGNPDH